MALRKAELTMIAQDYKIPVQQDFTVPQLIMAIRDHLANRKTTIIQAPKITAHPVITRGPEPYGKPVATPQQMPPDAPPLTDSDDDIVITVEPM